MPNYRYQCKHGHILWDFVDRGTKAKVSLVCDVCEEVAERARRINTQSSSGWPYSSDALGVGPDQIKEAGDSLAAAGIPTSFDKEGGLIVESRDHRNKVMGHLGMFDKDAGYGDRAPGKIEPEEAVMATGEENAD